MTLRTVHLQRCSRRACVIHRRQQHQIKYCYRCYSYCSTLNYGSSMMLYNVGNVLTSHYTSTLMQQRFLGDFSTSTFHYCNPEHGVAYSSIDRRMREDEMEDFMKSVKGWKYLYEEEEEHEELQEHYLLESLFENMEQSKFTSDEDNNNKLNTETQSCCIAPDDCRLTSVTNVNNARSDSNNNNNNNNSEKSNFDKLLEQPRKSKTLIRTANESLEEQQLLQSSEEHMERRNNIDISSTPINATTTTSSNVNYTNNIHDSSGNDTDNNNNNSNDEEIESVKRINDEDGPPPAAEHFLAHDAIKRTFKFDTFNEAYLYFGRLFAFCYFEDKYPHVEWRNNKITIYLYSPRYKGLTRREARIAAFANDQYNMFRKDKKQQRKLKETLLGVTDSTRTDEACKYNNAVHGKVNESKSSFANNIVENCVSSKVEQNKCKAQIPKLKIAELFAQFAPTELQEQLHKQLQSENVNASKTKVKLEEVGTLFDFSAALDPKK